MAKRVVWTEQARADVRAIDQQTALRVLHSLGRFAQSEQGDALQLQDVKPPLFRFRAQDYRVFFRDRGDSILITRVLHRREAYRD